MEIKIIAIWASIESCFLISIKRTVEDKKAVIIIDIKYGLSDASKKDEAHWLLVFILASNELSDIVPGYPTNISIFLCETKLM